MRWLLLLAGLLVNGPALAGFPLPDPTTSVIPACVMVVGNDGTFADPIGTFSVIVNDAGGFPIAGIPVTVSFLGCPYIGICPVQLFPGIFAVDCPGKSVTAITNAVGVATFSIMGAATPVPCPAEGPGCAVISAAPGFVLGTTSVAALDLGGGPGLSGIDLSEWLGGYFCGLGGARLDYDCDGSVGGGDLSLWLSAFFAAGSVLGCGPPLCK